jgi:hypothetical protein
MLILYWNVLCLNYILVLQLDLLIREITKDCDPIVTTSWITMFFLSPLYYWNTRYNCETFCGDFSAFCHKVKHVYVTELGRLTVALTIAFKGSYAYEKQQLEILNINITKTDKLITETNLAEKPALDWTNANLIWLFNDICLLWQKVLGLYWNKA